jgi:hypothetical protein
MLNQKHSFLSTGKETGFKMEILEKAILQKY